MGSSVEGENQAANLGNDWFLSSHRLLNIFYINLGQILAGSLKYLVLMLLFELMLLLL